MTHIYMGGSKTPWMPQHPLGYSVSRLDSQKPRIWQWLYMLEFTLHPTILSHSTGVSPIRKVYDFLDLLLLSISNMMKASFSRP